MVSTASRCFAVLALLLHGCHCAVWMFRFVLRLYDLYCCTCLTVVWCSLLYVFHCCMCFTAVLSLLLHVLTCCMLFNKCIFVCLAAVCLVDSSNGYWIVMQMHLLSKSVDLKAPNGWEPEIDSTNIYWVYGTDAEIKTLPYLGELRSLSGGICQFHGASHMQHALANGPYLSGAVIRMKTTNILRMSIYLLPDDLHQNMEILHKVTSVTERVGCPTITRPRTYNVTGLEGHTCIAGEKGSNIDCAIVSQEVSQMIGSIYRES